MKNILTTHFGSDAPKITGIQDLIQQSAGNAVSVLSTHCIRGRHPGVYCHCISCLQPGNKIKSHQPVGPSSRAQYGSGYEVSDFTKRITQKNVQMK